MLVRDSADLAVAVTQARKSLGLSQQELADLAEVSVRSISALESGFSSMGFSKLMSILSVLGLSLRVEVTPIG